MSVKECVEQVQRRIREAALAAGRNPEEITLVAATKVQTSETIREAIAAGIRVCGENRVQEFNRHWEEGAYEGARVHFIGHLQRNKVKYLVGKVDLIESVDSLPLLTAIQERSAKLGVVQDILIEVNVAGEASKSGVEPEALEELLNQAGQMDRIRVRGLMSIPPVSLEPGGNVEYFRRMRQLFIDTQGKMADNRTTVDILSMGMSGDFEDAIACGATQVRVGTALFGARPSNRANG
jgi:pyridoxal phosphate enzyme (YggS family)